MSYHAVYRDGRVHIQATMCDTCIFRPGNRMRLNRGRVREMIDAAKAGGGVIPCHKKLDDPNDAAVCRGFFDKHPTPLLELAERMGIIEEVPVRGFAQDDVKFTVMARAADCATDGRSACATIGVRRRPTQGQMLEYREAIVSTFRQSFGTEPARVAVVFLPYVEEVDDISEGTCDATTITS